jgi:hypothetical protein
MGVAYDVICDIEPVDRAEAMDGILDDHGSADQEKPLVFTAST